ncbi:MAG TPA: saccharopine dehydrogenase NADP-binding domain-containing protein [Solirubrobacteraceae bacterium]|nr:saccharopine dehydrogenase NADP-binding domain-containing protein [Solirubrobacteraceae bacterium]
MAGRIVLFGATGYTGRLTARALVERGAEPLLAARSEQPLRTLAKELGGLPTQTADVNVPDTVAALVGPGDVLVSTVGPFVRWGTPAVEAALAKGAHYIDSTGEGQFIRRVFEQWGPRAVAAGVGLLTAFGYDFVPGNLAGGLALREAGPSATRLQIAYFAPGGGRPADVSGGTRASAAGAMIEPGFTWRGGRIVTERGGARVKRFAVEPGSEIAAVSIAASEAFALPRLALGLRELDTYLGFGRASYAMAAVSAASSALLALPGARPLARRVVARSVRTSTGGPDERLRAASGSLVLARAFDDAGELLASVRLSGVNVYTFTASILAWGAMTTLEGGLQGTGALGPCDAFGLDALEQGAAQAGIAAAAPPV